MEQQHQTVRVLKNIANQIRADVLRSTTIAGSGHPTSCLSSVELCTALFFGGTFRADLRRPLYPNNDRLIFSKGHAAPLLYALYAAAGVVTLHELCTLRMASSNLEGHPTSRFRYTDIPTGSLGQGLGAGLGMAMASSIDRLPFRTYVVLGDGELAEGSIWEAVQLAGHRKVYSLTALIDVNRLGQSGPTMVGRTTTAYARRFTSFGWSVISVDGHDFPELLDAYQKARHSKKPTAILARTIKGKGVSFLENKSGWHGKTLSVDEYHRTMRELSPSEGRIKAKPSRPKNIRPRKINMSLARWNELREPSQSLRDEFGRTILFLAQSFPTLVVLDGDVQNSTKTEYFNKKYPERFIQGYIAEQNIVSMAAGLAARGKLPCVSTFSAFLTRAYDQLRMAQYNRTHQVYVGTHAGISVGHDGPSQMGLEDIAMFRTLHNTTILSPSDGISTRKLTLAALRCNGIVYLRLPRVSLPSWYLPSASFRIGGSHVLQSTKNDRATVIACGVTVRQAMIASAELLAQGTAIRVIDAYSVHPLDIHIMLKAAKETKHLIVVEDHRGAGGLGEAVRSALGRYGGAVTSLSVDCIPHSGDPDTLLHEAHIDAAAIVEAVRSLL